VNVKAKYLILEIGLNAGRAVRVAEALRRSVMHGDDFDWLGCQSANQEALEVSSRGSNLLCTPSLG